MACYFMPLPYVQSGTSTKTQAMETKPLERELEMMKMELQRPGRNFRPPVPELPARCPPDSLQMPSSAQKTGPSRNFRPEGPKLPPTGTSAQVPPKFRKSVKTILDVTAGQWRNSGTRPELGRNFRPDRNFRPSRPELPPLTGTSAQVDRNFRPIELQHNSTFQRVTYLFAPTYK